MAKCKNLVVFITGASSGIGKACANAFAEQGANLLLCARRAEKLKSISETLQKKFSIKTHLLSLDISDLVAVEQAITNLPQEWQDIDILVNNAGVALGLDKIQDGNIQQWNEMIDTNIKGLLYVTKFVLPGMLKRKKGHIINLGSISSHQVYSGGTVYCSTKFAEKAISEGIKMDVHGSPIRVTSIDPGMVKTEFSMVRFSGDIEKAEKVYHGMTPLFPEDVADAILYSATRPLHVNIREIKIYPTDQTAAHLCHRDK